MEYTVIELVFFLLCYSFLGWCMETIFYAIYSGGFRNRGLLNLPLALPFGIAMDFILILTPSLKENIPVILVMDMVILSACDYLANFFSIRLTGKRLWNFEEFSVYTSFKFKSWIRTIVMTIIALAVVYLIHPVLYIYIQWIPVSIIKIVDIIFLCLIFIDTTAVVFTLRKKKENVKFLSISRELSEDMQEKTEELGNWMTRHVWRRIHRAYPDLHASKIGEEEKNEKAVFARGLCIHKLIWIFIISALLGDLIETLYCRMAGGTWMSRSSVIYGPFSIVWGMGAVLLTVLLYRLSDKEDRYVFLGGCVLGGTYEYLCSVLSEVFLGTTFWDYSEMPFNIGGRTNLLYCVFWGILAVFWIKIFYPKISSQIEKIPTLTGIILTWCLVIFMVFNLTISAMAVVRYVDRKENNKPDNAVEKFIDEQYPDRTVEFVWPNLKIVKE